MWEPRLRGDGLRTAIRFISARAPRIHDEHIFESNPVMLTVQNIHQYYSGSHI